MGGKDEKQVAELGCEEGKQSTEKYCHNNVLGKMVQEEVTKSTGRLIFCIRTIKLHKDCPNVGFFE